MVLCAGVIVYVYQSGRAIAESTHPKSTEIPQEIAETSPPKDDKPEEKTRTESKAPLALNTSDAKPTPNAKPKPFDELPEFYKKYENVLSKYVNEKGQVDYAKLRRKRSDLFNAVRTIGNVEPLQYMKWDDNEKIAFWINSHNLFTLKLIIDNYPIESRFFMIFYPKNCIMQIPKGRQNVFFDIIEMEYAIREIEFEMLLDRFEDLRVIFALTYASNSGAFLSNHAYIPSTLDEQLDEQVRKFLTSDRGLKIDQKEKIVYLSGIFNWYKKYFMASDYAKLKKFRKHPDNIRAYLNFIFKYASKENAAYLESNDFTVKFLPYDWRLNEPASR